MKYLALIDVEDSAALERVQAEISGELIGLWQLFASGVLREAYATSTPTRVVFVLEVDGQVRAEEHLRTLPLIAAGLLHVDLVELQPFVNWARLFASPSMNVVGGGADLDAEADPVSRTLSA